MLDEAKRSYQVAESLDIGLEEAKQGEQSAEAALSAFQPPLDQASPREDGLAQKYVDAALLLQALGRFEEALREADRALEIEPRSAAAALRKASILMDMGRLEEAVPPLTSALKGSPAPADAALELEAISYRMGRRDEGVRVLKPYLEDLEARKRTALAEASAGRPEVALELLSLPEGRDLSHDRLRALALMSKGDHAQSSELLAKLSKAYGPSPQLLNDLAVSLRLENRLEEAEEALGKAIEAEPRYPDAWNNLGCLHYLQGAFEEAERAFKEAILLDRRPAFMLHLGMAQLARDDLDAAEASFDSALRLDASAEALNCLGIVAERRKDNARALELYEEALKRAPEFRDAQYNKARAKAALKVG
ncbi:MAG: tetratricopeptide repeat protein [Methanomassiliicoccales archaeon]|nr:tetratricopeptide repeat protein [Methanomassiliicoccales archaeon]